MRGKLKNNGENLVKKRGKTPVKNQKFGGRKGKENAR